jgi:hypothetical protein
MSDHHPPIVGRGRMPDAGQPTLSPQRPTGGVRHRSQDLNLGTVPYGGENTHRRHPNGPRGLCRWRDEGVEDGGGALGFRIAA